MLDMCGTVDHFVSCEVNRKLAYEWSNYRYCSAWINSSKQTANDDVLDPFDVQDGWFEIVIPGLQLVVTNRVPHSHQALAEATVERLHLRDDERVMRQRTEWLRMYRDRELTLEGLVKVAPLIAAAVIKHRIRPRDPTSR
jgi:hypothetical protein